MSVFLTNSLRIQDIGRKYLMSVFLTNSLRIQDDIIHSC